MAKSKKKNKAAAPKKRVGGLKKVNAKAVKKVAPKKKVGSVAKAPIVESVERLATDYDVENNPKLKIGDVLKFPKDQLFHLHIEMNDEVFDIDTSDVKQAIIDLKPAVYKTKVVIKASYLGQRPAEFVLFNAKAKRLFTNALTAEFFAKHLKLALNAAE